MFGERSERETEPVQRLQSQFDVLDLLVLVPVVGEVVLLILVLGIAKERLINLVVL